MLGNVDCLTICQPPWAGSCQPRASAAALSHQTSPGASGGSTRVAVTHGVVQGCPNPGGKGEAYGFGLCLADRSSVVVGERR